MVGAYRLAVDRAPGVTHRKEASDNTHVGSTFKRRTSDAPPSILETGPPPDRTRISLGGSHMDNNALESCENQDAELSGWVQRTYNLKSIPVLQRTV